MGIGSEVKTRSNVVANFTLRSHHAYYLRRLAERDDVSISQAFRGILEHARANAFGTPPTLPARLRRSCIMVSSEQLLALDAMAVQCGLTRSEVARRLIDSAMAEERG